MMTSSSPTSTAFVLQFAVIEPPGLSGFIAVPGGIVISSQNPLPAYCALIKDNRMTELTHPATIIVAFARL